MSSFPVAPPRSSINVPPPVKWHRQSSLEWLVPLGLIGGFAILLASLFADRLWPAPQVQATPSLLLRQGTELTSILAADEMEAQPTPTVTPATEDDQWKQGTISFQASGWVEPDPLPIKATSLIDGVVKEVHVLEGKSVSKGEALATLVDDDARLDLETALSELETLRGQYAAHCTNIPASNARMESARKQLAADEARLKVLEDESNRINSLTSNAVSAGEIIQSALKADAQRAQSQATASVIPQIEAELAKLQAEIKVFEAQLSAAETEVSRKKLALERTVIRSPVDGIVLRLLAVPGQKRMLGMDDEDSATIAILYQPDRLQARIDVPLSDAGGLMAGQKVRLKTDLLPDVIFRGEVTRIVGEANLQRNTLQAKVRILNPDPRLRPEMLCRAEFLAPVVEKTAPDGTSTDTSGGTGRYSIWAPAGAIKESDGEGPVRLWILDKGIVQPRPVTLGTGIREGYREIKEGLRPGELVVTSSLDSLKPGQRARLDETTLSR
jgi:HlyD family secretion protein